MILVYHKVAATTETPWWVSTAAFYRQMCELRSRQVVYLDDYDPRDPRHAVVTFDGVYENVHGFALPILQHFGYPFELFVIGDRVGRDNDFDVGEPRARFASAEQLAAMVRGGGRLQFHSRSHARIGRDADRGALVAELEVAPELRKLDPRGFGWFGYPHGEFSETAVEEVRKRFRGAVTCDQGNATDPYRLNRATATESTRLAARTIGVLVPSYNYGRFLVEAVESVLRQTLPPDRIVIIDDASQDETPEVGRAYAEEYPGLIRFERNEQNLGIVPTFNRGVDLLGTDYVCVVGADNRVPSHYLAACAARLDADPACGVAFSDFALFGDRAGEAYGTFPAEWQAGAPDAVYWMIRFPDPAPGDALAVFRQYNFLHGSSMYRRAAFEQVGGYRRRTVPEDYDLFGRMLEGGWRCRRADTFLEYRQHSADQTNARVLLEQRLAFLDRIVRGQRDRIAVLEHELGRAQATRMPVVTALGRHVRAVYRSVRAEGWGATSAKVQRKLGEALRWQ